LKYAEGVR